MCDYKKKIIIPKHPRFILDTLEKNGYEAFIVGGCVRDVLLGKIPSDYDITTNAKPEEIKKLFRKTIDTGIKHGTVSVVFYDNDKFFSYEVTTYRKDGEYEDCRHPKNVEFVSNLEEDLKRRDFTVNAMAYNDKVGLVDLFGGKNDLKNKLIKAVGNPIERFTEDALRLLRAIRFASKLGFNIEINTINAIPKLATNLKKVSKERIQVELTKIITSGYPEYIVYIFCLDLAKNIFDGFEKIKTGHIIRYSKVSVSYASLFYFTDIEFVKEFLKNIKMDNHNFNKTILLLKGKILYEEIYEKYKNGKDIILAVKNLIKFIDYELIFDFLNMIRINEKDNICDEIIEIVNLCIYYKLPIFIKDLKIDGNDLKKIGYLDKEIGITLNRLLEIVHIDYTKNNKKELLEIAKKVYKNYRS